MNAVISKTAHKLFPISLDIFTEEGKLVHSSYTRTEQEALREALSRGVADVIKTPALKTPTTHYSDSALTRLLKDLLTTELH